MDHLTFPARSPDETIYTRGLNLFLAGSKRRPAPTCILLFCPCTVRQKGQKWDAGASQRVRSAAASRPKPASAAKGASPKWRCGRAEARPSEESQDSALPDEFGDW